MSRDEGRQYCVRLFDSPMRNHELTGGVCTDTLEKARKAMMRLVHDQTRAGYSVFAVLYDPDGTEVDDCQGAL